MLRHTAHLPPGTFELLTDPNLLRTIEGSRLKVLIGLAQHGQLLDEETWVVTESRAELAQAIGMSEPTLRKNLDKLAEKGWIYLTAPISHGPHQGRTSGKIWLLWTAPVRADGQPWRPHNDPTEPPLITEKTLTEKNFRETFLQEKNFHHTTPPPPHKTSTHPPQEVADLHTSINPPPTHKHAQPQNTPRLLDGNPCPPLLDEALTALGFQGHINLPETPVPVEVEDLHDLVNKLLTDREAKIARGGHLNIGGILRNRLKDGRALHEELSAAQARGYLARYRAAHANRDTRPPWCGKCTESTRLRENTYGLPYRCPTCHPLEAGLPEAL